MNYVDRYLRLEDTASTAESKVEEYLNRADQNRWEQCRVAHEAVTSGEFNQTTFAEAVGKSRREISRQMSVWSEWALAPTKPRYADAVAEVMGTTAAAETDRKQMSNARSVLATPAGGKLVRQAVKADHIDIDDKVGMLDDLMSDPKVLRAYREHRAPNVSAADAKAASAIAKALTDPIARSATKLQVPMWLDQLRTIREVLAEYEFDESEVNQLDRAVQKVMDELVVQKFRLGLEVDA